MFRPTELGANGFLHPPTTWGNGVTTTPDLYTALLNTVASHGFVVIASNSTAVTAEEVKSGLDWLIMQNETAGDFQGKLAVKCAAAIGYSMGGGAAVGAAAHPNVIATVALHGLQGPASQLHGPLLLITSTNDGFVTKSGFVQPTYDGSSKVPTIMATLNVPGAAADFAGHLIPLGDAGEERAPLIAWLRLYVYGDQAAKPWFYGAGCTLCKDPWTDIQRKNGDWE
jgi:pimeloyl-ACP methyl ester carboxylesterase